MCCRNLSTGSHDATKWIGAFLKRDIHVMEVLRVLSDHRNTVEQPLRVLLLSSLASRHTKKQRSGLSGFYEFYVSISHARRLTFLQSRFMTYSVCCFDSSKW